MLSTTERQVRIEVSADRLRAHLLVPDGDPAQLTRSGILAQMEALSIPVTETVGRRIDELLAHLTAGRVPNEPVLLAEGSAAVAAAGARFELAPHAADPAGESDPADPHRTRIVTARAGQPIGVLTPEVAPVDGQDVFGRPLPASRTTRSMRLGKNVRLAEDNRTVVAVLPGKVQVTRDEVTVLEVVEIDGDVDLSTGNIDAPADVLIKGTVRATFKVRSVGKVVVKGAIEAAAIEAGTDVHVEGGVVGNAQGQVVAGRDIRTKFCDAADLQAKNNIVITAEAMQSRVYAGGRLDMSRGTLVGGEVYAREGAEVKELGNQAGVRTQIAIGIDPTALAEAERVAKTAKQNKQAAANIRTQLQPLMAYLRQLSPTQRERATELMYQADQLEAEADEQQRRVTELIATRSPTAQPTVRVVGKVFPGVTVIFGDRKTTFNEEHRGPLKILRRPSDQGGEIVLIHEHSGAATALPGCSSINPPA